jgi:ketosteroid isomerase-like protein
MEPVNPAIIYDNATGSRAPPGGPPPGHPRRPAHRQSIRHLSPKEMEDAMASTGSEIRELFDRQSGAIRMKDVDGLMSLYSADIVYFDVVPPLRYVGSAALRGRFREWFDGYQSAIDMDVRELTIAASGDIAVTRWLSRARGTLKNGLEVGSWVRATSCWQRTHHGWLVTHEHISLPVDFATRSAATDLVP